MFDLFKEAGFTFVPEGALYGPGGSDVDEVEAGEQTREGSFAVGDGIGFDEKGYTAKK